jgi:transposase
MSKHRHVELTDEQRQQLHDLIRRGSDKARTITRARILLLTDRSQGEHRTDEQVASAVLCSKGTVIGIRHRFLAEGLEAALTEKPRPGASLRPKITGEVEATLISLTCSEPPEGHARWTLQLLADRLVELQAVDSISDVAVMNCLKKRAKTLAGR